MHAVNVFCESKSNAVFNLTFFLKPFVEVLVCTGKIDAYILFIESGMQAFIDNNFWT